MANSAVTEDTFTFVVGIAYIDSHSDLRGGINLGHGLRLVKDARRVASLCAPYAESLGTLETASLTRNPLAVIGTTRIGGPHSIKEKAAFVYARYVGTYMRQLWLVKDCSPMLEQAYLLGNDMRGRTVHANRVMDQPTCSDGCCRPTIFSEGELTGARTLARQLPPELGQTESESEDWWRSSDTVAERGSTRLGRCLGMIETARRSYDLGLKVAQYCTALEALLATGTSELRHQLAERLAWLHQPSERIAVYRRTQALYDLRSRVLHGDVIPKAADLKELASTADGYCRRAVLAALEDRALTEALNDEDSLKSYFLERVLGQGRAG